MDLPPSGFTTQTDPAAIKSSFESLRSAVSELLGAMGETPVTADNNGLLTLPRCGGSFLVSGNVQNIIAPAGYRDGAMVVLRGASPLSIANAANTQPGSVLTEDGNALALDGKLSAILKYDAASSKWAVLQSSTLTRLKKLELFASAVQDASTATAARFAQLPPSGNLVVNGNFDFYDPWAAISDGPTFAAELNGYSVDVSAAGGNRAGILQIIEARDTIALRGQNAVLGYTLSGQSTYLVAVVEWTGAPDQISFFGGKNPIANWDSTNYAPGGFFSAASLLVSGVNTSPGNFLPVKVSSQANNLLIVFAELTPAQPGGKFNLSQVSLYGGSEQRAFYPSPYVVEQLRCDRIKSLPFGT